MTNLGVLVGSVTVTLDGQRLFERFSMDDLAQVSSFIVYLGIT